MGGCGGLKKTLRTPVCFERVLILFVLCFARREIEYEGIHYCY